MKFKVFKASQTLYIPLFETENEEEARKFCEQNNWELKDENDFVWELYYETYYSQQRNLRKRKTTMDIRLTGTQKEIDKIVADFDNYYDVISVSTPYANTRKQVKSQEVRVYAKLNMTYIDENGSVQKI